MGEEKTQMDPVVKQIEEQYPEMTREFKRIMREQYEIFCKKQANYGPDNIALGKDLTKKQDRDFSHMGIWFRMNDKVQRLKQLVFMNVPDAVGESIDDTYKDLSVYSIIAQIVKNEKWAK